MKHPALHTFNYKQHLFVIACMFFDLITFDKYCWTVCIHNIKSPMSDPINHNFLQGHCSSSFYHSFFRHSLKPSGKTFLSTIAINIWKGCISRQPCLQHIRCILFKAWGQGGSTEPVFYWGYTNKWMKVAMRITFLTKTTTVQK